MNSKESNAKELPYSSDDRTLALPAPRTSRSTSQAGEFTVEDYRTALRVLVGAALEGTDELRSRIGPWWENVQEWERESGGSVVVSEGSGGSPLLYTLLGLLFKTPDYLSRGPPRLAGYPRGRHLLCTWFTRPITHSRVMRPVQRRYNYFVARGESVMSSVMGIGRSEARSSRALVRQNVNDEALEDILTYLVEKAKMRELIAEQGVEAAADVSTEIRTRSAAVDSSLDNLVDNILRRQKGKTPPSGSSS